MRDTILTYLEDNMVTGFTLSTELPYDASGNPQYLNNFKKVYVDRTQTAQEPLLDALDGSGAVIETSTTNIYVVTDAKTLPTNYDALITMIRGARLDPTITGVTQRTTTMSTSYEADSLVTEFELSFFKVILNEE